MHRVVHQVRHVSSGSATSFADGRLVVGEEATDVVADPALAEVRVSCVSPGESVRVIKVLDGVEPRTKGPGGGGIFPGFLGPPRLDRGPEVHVLRGAAVIAAGDIPRAQEGLVDFSGPAADLSPFGGLHGVVVEFTPAEGAPFEEVDAAVRRGVLSLAAHLADAALDSPPDTQEEMTAPVLPGTGGRDLPRVGVLTHLQCQGAFKDVFVYGRTMAGGLATVLDPRELEDGAVVSGQYGHPALRNPTYLHQNHPVVAELGGRHGRDLTFGGLVVATEPVEQERKDLNAAHAARVCAALGWDAAIVTKEGGGNADGDMALAMDHLESLGVTAVGQFAEMPGPDGTGPPVVVPPRRATGLVSTGSYDERVELPAVERALGGDRLEVADADATDAVEVPVAIIWSALSSLGWGRLTCAEPAA